MSRRLGRLGEIGGRARGDGRPLELAHLDGPVSRDQTGQAGEHRREEEQKFQEHIQVGRSPASATRFAT